MCVGMCACISTNKLVKVVFKHIGDLKPGYGYGTAASY
jgi:hypothetical protein